MAPDALIIAAGFGSRLAACSPCKPLTPIAGVPLIELVVRQAAAAGSRRAVVVTGHRAEAVERFLADLSDRLDLPIACERLTDWNRPNGFSVMTGARRLAGDYLLLMADHLLERRILEQLARAAAPDRNLTLAVDRRLTGEHIDPADATWVRTGAAARIEAIGKALPSPSAVDCGAFLATAALSPAIERAIAGGRNGSLSDGVQWLADRGRAAVVEIGDGWWIDVDDPRSLALAEAQAPHRLAALYASVTGTSP